MFAVHDYIRIRSNPRNMTAIGYINAESILEGRQRSGMPWGIRATFGHVRCHSVGCPPFEVSPGTHYSQGDTIHTDNVMFSSRRVATTPMHKQRTNKWP